MKDWIKDILAVHWPALAAAFLLAFLIALPQIVFPYVAGEAYRGINIANYGNDERHYLSRGKEVLEGHPLGQPFIAQGKNGQDTTFSYAEQILLKPLRILGLEGSINIVTYYNIANAIGVFFVALLMYAFMWRVSGERWIALAGPFFAIAGYSIPEAHTLFYGSYDIYGRSPFPFMSSVSFFGLLCMLYESLVRKRTVLFTIAAGVLFGLTFYIYFYAWTFSLALIGTLFLVYLALRDWEALQRVCAIGAIGILLGSYQIISLVTSFSGPMAVQLSYFYLSVHAYTPVMSKFGLVTLALFSLVVWRRGRYNVTPFIAAVIVAGWIALNQQIITGRIVQYGHFFWYFVSPLSIMLAAYLLWRLLPPQFARILPALIITVGFLNMAGQQYRAFAWDVPDKLSDQRYAPVLQKLNNLPPGTVLTDMGGDKEPFLITIYTRHDLYWLPSAIIYETPIDRLKEALLVSLYLNRDARNDPIGYIRALVASPDASSDEALLAYQWLEGFNSGFDYYDYQRRVLVGDPALLPVRDKLLAQLRDEYKSRFSVSVDILATLKERGVAYIVWDMRRNPKWDLSKLGPLTTLATSTDLVLYGLPLVQ